MSRRASPGSDVDARRDLVLVGGGHAHVQILRRWAMRPVPGVRLVVVLDQPIAVYSGMVPARVAGEIETGALEIDVVPLARRAQAAVILAPALRIDPKRKQIELRDRPPLPYDFASLDVGSTVRGLELPGVREHAVTTRPISHFTREIDRRLDALGRGAGGTSPRITVVGAGAAGVELALTLDARLRRAGTPPKVTLLTAGDECLAGANAALRRRAARELRERGVEWAANSRVVEVHEGAVVCDEATGRTTRDSDLVVWATGAAPPEVIRESALPRDGAGFVRTLPTLQVEDAPSLFAVGDCASLGHAPWVTKAGVYAVRQGPALDRNLRAALAGKALREYRPQRDFLALLNCGDGRAIASKWGVALAGPAMHRLKARIDRRFMERFQVLAAGAALQPEFAAPMPGMNEDEMLCGGCAAKLGASPLERALARMPPAPADESVLLGLAQADDAAAVRFPTSGVDAPDANATLLLTIDGFKAFTDDPFLVGKVAAQNALSDLFAKGARPRHALANLCVSEEDPLRAEEELAQALAGVRAALDPLGVSLLGGHTTIGDELAVGLAITGELGPGEALLPLAGARPGDTLILTKALGTGVLFAADMRGRARGPWIVDALEAMEESNRAAAEIAREAGASACTDISGFGLAGHLAEMMRASRTSAVLELGELPALEGALDALSRGLKSSAHDEIASGRKGIAGAAGLPDDVAIRARFELLFDPQTSGGLLFTVTSARSAETLEELRTAGCRAAAAIGRVEALREDGASIAVLR